MLLKLLGGCTFLAFWVDAVSAVQHSQFIRTCTGVKYNSQSELVASCMMATADSATPSQHTSALDLNLCLGFSADSGLSWEIYGKFSEDCPSCSLESLTGFLVCNCTSSNDNTLGSASVDLNEGIGNDDGVLTCMGGAGN